MAWLAVDEDGSEYIYDEEPSRYNEFWDPALMTFYTGLPKGTIEKIIGKKLTWDDEPVEIK